MKNAANLNRILEWLRKTGHRPDIIIASTKGDELTWIQEYDWNHLKDTTGSCYVLGDTADVIFLSEKLPAHRFKDFDEMERFLLETKNETMLLLEYFACLKVWECFASKGYVEHFWEN